MKGKNSRPLNDEQEINSLFTPAPRDGGDTGLLLQVLAGLKKGDFSARLPLEWTGIAGRIADAFNEVLERNERLPVELERISQVVGKEGKIDQRASIADPRGSWAKAVNAVNTQI